VVSVIILNLRPHCHPDLIIVVITFLSIYHSCPEITFLDPSLVQIQGLSASHCCECIPYGGACSEIIWPELGSMHVAMKLEFSRGSLSKRNTFYLYQHFMSNRIRYRDRCDLHLYIMCIVDRGNEHNRHYALIIYF
jgi:hypothetical protein